MPTRFVILALIPIALASYLLRTLVVVAFRTRAPRVATAADALWAWVPLLVVLVVLAIVNPILGLAASIAVVLFLRSGLGIGSPFRPRR